MMPVIATNIDKISNHLSSFIASSPLLDLSLCDSPNERQNDLEITDLKEPKTRPLNLQAFYGRVSTFVPGTWTVQDLSPLTCARYGWQLIENNFLQCVTCRAVVSTKLPPPNDYEAYKVFFHILKGRLLDGHIEGCGWQYHHSPLGFIRPPEILTKDNLRNLTNHARSIAQLESGLPYIDNKLFSDMLNVTKDQLMVVYNQSSALSPVELTATLLALCGWTCPRGSYLKCNLCQRSIGLWGFKTRKDQSSESLPSSTIETTTNKEHTESQDDSQQPSDVNKNNQNSLPKNVIDESETSIVVNDNKRTQDDSTTIMETSVVAVDCQSQTKADKVNITDQNNQTDSIITKNDAEESSMVLDVKSDSLTKEKEINNQENKSQIEKLQNKENDAMETDSINNEINLKEKNILNENDKKDDCKEDTVKGSIESERGCNINATTDPTDQVQDTKHSEVSSTDQVQDTKHSEVSSTDQVQAAKHSEVSSKTNKETISSTSDNENKLSISDKDETAQDVDHKKCINETNDNVDAKSTISPTKAPMEDTEESKVSISNDNEDTSAVNKQDGDEPNISMHNDETESNKNEDNKINDKSSSTLDQGEDSANKDSDKRDDSGKGSDKSDDSGEGSDKSDDGVKSDDSDEDKDSPKPDNNKDDTSSQDSDNSNSSSDDSEKSEDSSQHDGNKSEASSQHDGDKREASSQHDGDKSEASSQHDGDKSEASSQHDGDKREASSQHDGDKKEASSQHDGDKREASSQHDGDKREASSQHDGDKKVDSSHQDCDKIDDAASKDVCKSNVSTSKEKLSDHASPNDEQSLPQNNQNDDITNCDIENGKLSNPTSPINKHPSQLNSQKRPHPDDEHCDSSKTDDSVNDIPSAKKPKHIGANLDVTNQLEKTINGSTQITTNGQAFNQCVKSKGMKRTFHPLDEHRHWCGWVINHTIDPEDDDDDDDDDDESGEDGVDEATLIRSRKGYQLTVTQLKFLLLPSNFSTSFKSTENVQGVRAVRSLLNEWASVNEDDEDEDMYSIEDC